MNFKNFSNFKSGFPALFKKTAMEFRKTIINYNELTRIYVLSSVFCEKNKNFDREIKNGDCFKIVNFRFLRFLDCNIWFRDMHARLKFFLPYPARSGFLKLNPAQLNTWIKQRNSVRISGPVLLGPISVNQAKQPNKSIKYVTIIRHKYVYKMSQ